MKHWKSILLLLIILLLTLASLSSLSFFRFFRYKKSILVYSRKYQLDPLLVTAIIMVESRFQPWARSSRGAIGLMQLMPGTAQEIARKLKIPSDIKSLYQPGINLNIGCFYLAQLQKKYHNDLVLILTAYSAGPKRTQQWLNTTQPLIANRYSRKYVTRVINTYYKLRTLNRWIRIIPTN